MIPSSGFLAGAHCDPAAMGESNWLDALNVFDGYLGIPLGVTKAKIYQQENPIFTTIPKEVLTLSSAGCQFLLCAFPLRAGFASSLDPNGFYGDTRTKASRDALGRCLDAWQHAGIRFDCTLRQESNLRDANGRLWFPSPQAYADYCRFYAPEVTSRGIRLAYNPGIADHFTGSAVRYFPPGVGVGCVYADYYGSAFRAGNKLDSVIGLADGGNPDKSMLPWGLGDWGNSATGAPITPAEWDLYARYLYNTIKARTDAGRHMCAVMYYSGSNPHGPNAIQGHHDYKIYWIKKISGLGYLNYGRGVSRSATKIRPGSRCGDTPAIGASHCVPVAAGLSETPAAEAVSLSPAAAAQQADPGPAPRSSSRQS
jgi:hypothetical protein